MPTSPFLYHRKLTLALALFCLVLALLFAGLLYEVNADAACSAFTSVSVRGSGIRLHSESTVLLEVIANWELDGDRYTEAIGRPEYTLYLYTDEAHTVENKEIMLIYPSRVDDSAVVVFHYTFERMFGDHVDPDLHNHPNCRSGSTERANMDVLIAAIQG